MRICKDGAYRDATPEEIAALERGALQAQTAERKRPYTQDEVSRLLIMQQINTLQVDDSTALRMKSYYPEWEPGQAYAVGYKVQYQDRLFKVRQAHSSQTGWEPSVAASLWEEICEAHDGSEFDPIPYNGNMELLDGLYYSEGGVLYRCTRGTGQPVHNALADLVGLYVEVVET